jgi:hypothetical protein
MTHSMTKKRWRVNQEDVAVDSLVVVVVEIKVCYDYFLLFIKY